MAKIIRRFRFKMIALLGLSMLFSGIITYSLYKVLQLYYRSQVRFENPLRPFRYFIREVGDINFF
ncbi:vancomycin resistance histidine kinase VanS, partial [Bacillus sp. SIMBA_069]